MNSAILYFLKNPVGNVFSLVLLVFVFSSITTKETKAQSSLPEIQQPTFHVGFKAVFLRDGVKETWKVAERTQTTTTWKSTRGGGACTWTSLNTGVVAPALMVYGCAGNGNKMTQDVELTEGTPYPIKLGNSFSYSYQGESTRGGGRFWDDNKSCSIKETKNISVQGNAFDAYVISCKDKWNTRVYYYSPNIDGPLKLIRIERDHRRRGRSLLERVIE